MEHGTKPKRGIFASPRLGKTNCATFSLRSRAQAGLLNRALVTAPLKVCPTWEEVLHGAGLPIIPLHEMSAAKIASYFDGKSWEGVAIVNRDKLVDCVEPLGTLDAFVADESHNYAAVSSGRAKAYRRLARTTPWVRALTGTPTPRHYGSLWSQLSPFDPARWGTSFESFARRFLVRDAMFPSRILAHINVDELQQMILAVASIYRREDIWGPDQYQFVTRHVDMPERAWKLYHKLAKEWIIDEFETDVIAANAGVRLMRLQQLTSGYVPGGADGAPTPIHQAKLDMLIEDLDEIVQNDEKSIVWHRFIHEGRTTVDEIRRVYPNVPVFEVNGKTDSSGMGKFQECLGACVIVVQQQSGAEGIKLDTADHAMYLSRTFSFVDDEQSRDRGFAPHKPMSITYYEIPGTVDDFVHMLLESKQTVHQAVRNCDRESLVYGSLRRKRTA